MKPRLSIDTIAIGVIFAPEAICIALHPGSVDTPLSSPFAKTGLDVRPPDQAAAEILDAIEHLQAGDRAASATTRV